MLFVVFVLLLFLFFFPFLLKNFVTVMHNCAFYLSYIFHDDDPAVF